MIEKRERRDRRTEPRWAKAGKVSWGNAGTYATFPAWLSDESRSSVSFITSAGTLPDLGDRIELIGLHLFPQQYHVTRTAPYDGRLSLIACRRARAVQVERLTFSASET
ncbi:MAG: hypothetical protein KAV82_15140 [Phycisphaerae bacterium]|nr:hypothetical protein [Phycisphaerae bacterium]